MDFILDNLLTLIVFSPLVAAVIISTAKIPTKVELCDSAADVSRVTSTLNPVLLK